MNFLVPYLMRWNALNRSRYHQLFSKLAERGHGVHILQPPAMDSTDTGFLQVEETSAKNIFLHEVSVNKHFWGLDLPFNKIIKKGYYCLAINKQVDRWIRDFSIDVLLFYNLALYPLSKIESCLKVYDLGDDHAELLKHELGAFHNRWVIRAVETYMNKMMKSCDLVMTISKDLEKRYPVRSYVLPNGVNVEDAKIGGGLEIREKFGKPIVGFIGSLEYFIDFDLILEAVSRMKGITFIIAGGGRQLTRLTEIKRKKNLSNLHLTGGVKHSDILRYVDAMDICLNTFVKSPLTDAACPIKLFEYLACKKPVISSRIREVQNIDEGFLYYADSWDELIMTIDQILANPREAAIKAELGFQVVEKKYTWGKIAEDFLLLLEKAKTQYQINR